MSSRLRRQINSGHFDTRAPGTRQWWVHYRYRCGDAETALKYHLERFGRRVKPLADRTLETCPAATSPSGRAGCVSPCAQRVALLCRPSSRGPAKARDTETMNRLTIEIDAHELAGLLDA